ncbi:MAG: hypothetical protein ACP5OC_07520 [Thermoplasmata archaeon]
MIGNKNKVKILGGVIFLVMVMVLSLLVPASSASPPSNSFQMLNATKDPSLPTGFPAANFSNPQAAMPPIVPDTTPIVVNVTQFGQLNIPNGVWETIILNVTGYDGGTAYDYFNTFNVDNSTVWLGVNPEAGSWAVDVNISLFSSYFDHKSQITVSGSSPGETEPGEHRNFHGIQYNNYTLYFYPVPKGQQAPSYPTMVEPIHKGGNTVNIPTDTRAAFIQSIVIDGEFQYTCNPSWEGYYFNINGHKAANQFIYPWINSGGIDLFTWRPIYPPYMLNHQWTTANITGMLGLIEGNGVNLQMLASNNSPGIGLNVGNLFLYTDSSVLGAQPVSYSYHDGSLKTVSRTQNGLVNENGNNYSYYASYKNVKFSYSTLLRTTTGTILIKSSTYMRYYNKQLFPNSIWENLTQVQEAVIHTSVLYDEVNYHGDVQRVRDVYWPISFDYGAVISYLYSETGGLYFFNYSSYFFNVMEAYNESVFTTSNVNLHSHSSYVSTGDMIYGTNGEFTSILEEGPGFAIIVNITSSYHQTNKIYSYLSIQHSQGSVHMDIWVHHLSGVENNSTTYYVQENLTTNSIFSMSIVHGFNNEDIELHDIQMMMESRYLG